MIADLFMPGIDGVTLIKALRKRNPGFPVIAMSGVLLGTSGRTALDHLPNISELADVICLQKPFRPNDLLQAVAAALARAHRRPAPPHPIQPAADVTAAERSTASSSPRRQLGIDIRPSRARRSRGPQWRAF